MQKVPDTQHTARWSGTFVRELAGVPSKSFVGLDNADWTQFTITGSTVFIDQADGRPPLSWGGTGTLVYNYTDNLAFDVYEGITGTFCSFVAPLRRDYAVLATVNWLWASNNNIFEMFKLWLYTGAYPNGPTFAGTPTGIYRGDQIQPPLGWYRVRGTTPPYPTEWDIRTMTWMLMDLPSGSYTVQLAHCPWGQNIDRTVRLGVIVVL